MRSRPRYCRRLSMWRRRFSGHRRIPRSPRTRSARAPRRYRTGRSSEASGSPGRSRDCEKAVPYVSSHFLLRISALVGLSGAEARHRWGRRRTWDGCSLHQSVDSGQLGRERWDHRVLQCVDVGAERCGCDVVERFVGEGETYLVDGRLRQAVLLGGVADAGSGQLFPGREEGLELLSTWALPLAEHLGSQREIQDRTELQSIAQHLVERAELPFGALGWG